MEEDSTWYHGVQLRGKLNYLCKLAYVWMKFCLLVKIYIDINKHIHTHRCIYVYIYLYLYVYLMYVEYVEKYSLIFIMF